MPRSNALIYLSHFALFGSLFCGSLAFAQTNPNDPSQYPPTQYPPGQYPPGQYPPNQYPARLPGGIPVNIPVPQISLPGRHSKAQKSNAEESKITLASADGSLRKLGEKDLLLETSKEHVLKFRLLAKTRFLDTKGQPVRDSLLHPGDHLSVQASPDDPETAVQVILLRAGSSAERDAAAETVADSRIVIPTGDDLKHPHTAVAQQASNSEASNEAPAAADSKPAEVRSKAVPPMVKGSNANDQVIADAREAAAAFNSELPNFLVQQATTRYRSWMGPHNWQAMDVVTADVAVVNGKEDYRNIQVNGHAPQGPVEKTGSWSTGEFAITLEDILSPATNANFDTRGSDSIAGRDAWVYDLSVMHDNSHWVIVSDSGSKYAPAYTGSIWIDKETRRVLRIEQHAGELPRDFTYNKATSIVEYGFVRIEGKQYLLPVTSENSACFTGSSNCVRNALEFRNYRKFSADSDIKYDKFAGR